MLQLHKATVSQVTRIDSDRDVLPFPAGGVFGAPRNIAADAHRQPRRNSGSFNLAASIERNLDDLQRGIDRLTVELDEDERRDVLAAIPFRLTVDRNDPGPSAPAA